MRSHTNDRGGHWELVVDEPVLVEGVEVPDVVLADEVLLAPAPLPDSLQSHLGVSLTTNSEGPGNVGLSDLPSNTR